MDLRKKGCFILLLVLLVHVVGGNVVFNVEHKFGGRGKAVLKELKAHDVRRHGRMLAPADFQLGGNGNPTGSGEGQWCFDWQDGAEVLKDADYTYLLGGITLPRFYFDRTVASFRTRNYT